MGFTSKPMEQQIKIIAYKIKIFKESQETDIWNKANDEQPFSLFAMSLFNPDSSYIINDNGNKKNENINGLKDHVEIATSKQQKPNSSSMF